MLSAKSDFSIFRLPTDKDLLSVQMEGHFARLGQHIIVCIRHFKEPVSIYKNLNAAYFLSSPIVMKNNSQFFAIQTP